MSDVKEKFPNSTAYQASITPSARRRWRRRGNSYAAIAMIRASDRCWAKRNCTRWYCSIAAGNWCSGRKWRSRRSEKRQVQKRLQKRRQGASPLHPKRVEVVGRVRASARNPPVLHSVSGLRFANSPYEFTRTAATRYMSLSPATRPRRCLY